MSEPHIGSGRVYGWGKRIGPPKQVSKDVKSLGVGENHIILVTCINNNNPATQDVYVQGSNRFGQLGLPIFQSDNQMQKINILIGNNIKPNIQSFHCGAQHTFFITDKNEVYSMGLNIKGQLGHGNFENINKPKLVLSLLPSGIKNPKSLNPALQKYSKPPIVDLLEKFDLQVKLEEESLESILLLEQDEKVENIGCGALFTIVLTNRNRIFGCGFQGSSFPSASNNDDFLEKAKFRPINIDAKIVDISCGLAGAAALSKQGFVFVWGIFGKNVYHVPKKISPKVKEEALSRQDGDRYEEIKVGDEFAILLTSKGEVHSFGKNIDNQLGCEIDEVSQRPFPQKIPGLPLFKQIFAGRNHCFGLTGSNELWGWGSNRQNQIDASENFPIVMNPRALKTLPENTQIYPSSYNTYIVSRQKVSFHTISMNQKNSNNKGEEEMIKLSEYKKLLHDYQVLKSLNLTLLQKSQPIKKVSQQVQTSSKFDIDGVTKSRQFDNNIQIEWSQLDIIDRINEGGYGIIYKAKWREIIVVAKKFKIQNGDVSLRDFLSECNAMEAVRHPNIVMFLGAVTKAKNYSIILEYCSKGSLWSYLQNQENNISWEEKKRFALQIAQGVLYLHSCKPAILHRDLKSLNIFLDEHLRIKIGDFGWTKTLDEYMTNKIGTYQWMAPEVIGNKPYTEKADVFSYSIILWEIASREPPYRNINGAKVSEGVLYNDLRPTIPKKTPEPFGKLMRRCWENDPLKRPGFKEIIRQLQLMKI